MNKRELVVIAPVVLLGITAVLLTAGVDHGAARMLLGTLAVAAIVVGAVRSKETQSAEEAVNQLVVATPQAVVQTFAQDRRRPTFNRETGMLVEWYFRTRIEEEIARAKRYGQTFAVVSMKEAAPGGIENARASTKHCLREVDYAGDLGDTIAVCLPNTDRTGVAAVVQRLSDTITGIELSAAEFPVDGGTVSALLREDAWHVTSHEEAA